MGAADSTRYWAWEEFVTRHAKATTGADWLMETEENRVMSVFLHDLANGTPIHVDTTSAASKAAIERGKVLAPLRSAN